MNKFNEIINKKIQDGINEKLKDINPNELINKKLQDNFDKSLADINISNELRDKKMNNYFNTFINDKLEKLIHEKIDDKMNFCNKKINELKISNDVYDKKL